MPTPPPRENASDSADADPVQDWHAFVPTDTADHLATMDRAARDSGCGVPWQLLAAIARVESDFGRNMATSSAGAIGYGQFLPSSWQAFGNDGNAYDYRDALPAIATYLCKSGLVRDPRQALFAYNHADWYVDLVLSLAVKYDRMAPGAPTPDVLETGPSADAVAPVHYAPDRDLKARPHMVPGQVMWLGIPWHGRTQGSSIGKMALQSTTLSMLRAGFDLEGDPPDPAQDADDGLFGLADRAWASGLLPLDLYAAPNRQRGWSILDIRQHVAHGQPVVALVGGLALPGHPANDPPLDQPVVIVGLMPDGLVYNDPSFSSSLGYGLAIGDADFERAWRAATVPHQALAFAARPKSLARDAHVHDANPGEVFARMTATPTVLPTATPVPPTPTFEPTVEPTAMPVAVAAPRPTAVVDPPDVDPSPFIVAAAGALALAALATKVVRR